MSDETLAFTKGHGTGNDFVLILDEAGTLDLSPALVVALCDRRTGIGGDGVIRLTRAGVVEGIDTAHPDRWFMDLRNADGSTAEFSGNGARVLGAFLEHSIGEDLSEGFSIETRAGVRTISFLGGHRYAVGMGMGVVTPDAGPQVTIAGVSERRVGVPVDMGNPHIVVALESEDELDAADLASAPTVDPTPAAGANVELVVGLESLPGPVVRGRLRLRVHERGVGETLSCGTGSCASVLAARARWGEGAPVEWDVLVPGGELRVIVHTEGLTLEGPAILVAEGLVDLGALSSE
ncbi:MAG: diaminopimelate epimerase [Demequinaceae bacterium]|nr:diaminopimelate epimerase [Demequinaceae bacterium]